MILAVLKFCLIALGLFIAQRAYRLNLVYVRVHENPSADPELYEVFRRAEEKHDIDWETAYRVANLLAWFLMALGALLFV